MTDTSSRCRASWRPLTLSTTLIAAAALAACGGGSGDDSTAGGGGTITSAVALSGTASKGLMANADVKVHPVAADGSVDLTSTLAATTTDAEGRYSLSFDATVSRPYVVRVSAKADGSTTHLDEVTGTAQPLPAGFSMRSVITPSQAGTVTTSASITPFSEMVVAAAERAGGGISAGNTVQAVSTVSQLLGFDPTAVSARPVGSAQSEDEKKMAVMLAAVSQMASGGQLGCSGDDAGARTRCVVEALSASASTSSLKLTTGNGGATVDVSGALSSALGTVLTTPKLSGSVPGSLLAGVIATLGCKDSGCTPAAAGGSGSSDPTATAITAAKLLFNEIRSDWGAMFSRGGASLSGGAVNIQAWHFRSAMEGIEVPVDMLVKDTGTMLMGVDLYNDLMAGRSAQTIRSRGGDNQGSQVAGACGLFTATDLSTRATSSTDARVIGCRAVYRSSRSFTQNTIVTTEWVHGFTLEPQADGSFTYASRARQRVSSCDYSSGACTVTANTVLQPQLEASTGRLVPTLDTALGTIRGFTLAGDLPGGFAKGSDTLGSHHHTIALTGSIATAADGLSATSQSDTYAVSGTLKAYSDASTEIGTLTLRSGQLALSTLTAGGSPVGTLADLDLLWTTPGAEFEGTLKLKDVALTRSGESWVPTFGQLSGALRTTRDGVSTEFLKATLEARISGAGSYDEREADSASNRFGVDLTLTGTVTAPQRPVLEFTLGTTMHSDQERPDAVSFQYRTLVGGTPRMVVSGTATPGSDGSGARFMLREATSKLSLGWTGQPSSAELKTGDTLIGRIDASTRMLTFTDGSFVSLDIGL
ncbi:hypothetical protein ACU6VI_12045 [Sphaerotilus natans]|uniref:hypothetical protein n=1 Tax=Sphaerotilus natans TaxID=34103 RepID=UPI00406CF896